MFAVSFLALLLGMRFCILHSELTLKASHLKVQHEFNKFKIHVLNRVSCDILTFSVLCNYWKDSYRMEASHNFSVCSHYWKFLLLFSFLSLIYFQCAIILLIVHTQKIFLLRCCDIIRKIAWVARNKNNKETKKKKRKWSPKEQEAENQMRPKYDQMAPSWSKHEIR